MTIRAKDLERRALEAVSAPAAHPAKVASPPEPPIKGIIPDLAETPAAAVPDLPVAFRPHVRFPDLDRTLEAARAALPSGTAPRLIALVEQTLGGRNLAALTAAERGALRDRLRREIARSVPGAQRLQRALRDRFRNLRGARAGGDLLISTTDVRGGVWLFFHSKSAIDPVILGEAFVPVKPGTPLPRHLPDPAAAGLSGSSRWLDARNTLTTVRPPPPAKPTLARSELGPGALDRGPDLILEEVRRAEQAAAAAAAPRPRPRTPAAVTRAGSRTGRILDVQEFTAAVPGGAWDAKIVATAVTGPEIKRLPSSELDKVLPPAGDLSPAYARYARCHALGPILGDEMTVGLAYGPQKAFNLLQSNTIEGFLRWDAGRTGRLNMKAESTVTVSVFLQHLRVKGRRVPFLRAAHYDVDLVDGRAAKIVLAIDEAGAVTLEVRLRLDVAVDGPAGPQ
ncbi:hypothetical protein [Nonomuraea endophytica]|uniref:hypothetical protein n=1 Tax=Nonomuraea endophytica TaxID=714136 RepID=UPI0037C93576